MSESRTPTDAGNAAAMYAAEYHKARQRIERLELALAQAEEALRKMHEARYSSWHRFAEEDEEEPEDMRLATAALATIKELRDGK